MDLQSPLTQQNRPDVFEPKIVGLYRQIFAVRVRYHLSELCDPDETQHAEDDSKPEGFWRELFLLKPDMTRLGQTLEDLSADDLLHHQHQTQQLVLQAIEQANIGKAPADEHALDVGLSTCPRLARLFLTDSGPDSVLRYSLVEEIYQPKRRHHRSLSRP